MKIKTPAHVPPQEAFQSHIQDPRTTAANQRWTAPQVRKRTQRGTAPYSPLPATLERRMADALAPRDRAVNSAGSNSVSSEVIQGYFLKRSPGIFAVHAKQSDLDNALWYLGEQRAYSLESKFIQLSESSKNEGYLDDWLLTNVGKSVDEINLLAQFHDIQSKFPQTRPIPPSWVAATDSYNPGGPPITVKPPPMGPVSYFSPPIPQITPSSLQVDLSQQNFSYQPPGKVVATYPLTDPTRDDVRSSAMLTNSFIDYLTSQGMPLPQAKSTKAPAHGFTFSSGLRKGSTKSVMEAAGDLTKKERETHPSLYPNSNVVVAHHPDKVWTGVPQSMMGFHPITRDANTLEGDVHDLRMQVQRGKTLSGMVVREANGRLYRPTLEDFHAQQQFEKEQDESMEAYDEMLEQQDQEIIDLMDEYGSTEIVAKLTGRSEFEIEEIWENR